MSHKQAKRFRTLTQRLAKEGRGYPWVEDGDCIAGRPMCHDCAYRKDSKEMLAYQYGVSHQGADDGPPVLATVGSMASKMIDGGEPKPFYCHFDRHGAEVPKNEHGTYLYDLGEDGKPRNAAVCAGWLAVVERIKRVRELDGDVPTRNARPTLEREVPA